MIGIQRVESLAGIAVGYDDSPRRPLRVRFIDRLFDARPKLRYVRSLRCGRPLAGPGSRQSKRYSRAESDTKRSGQESNVWTPAED